MPNRDEIVKALLCRASKKEKDLCERYRRESGCTRCINTYMHDTIDLIEQQAKEIEQLRAERDAAIADLYRAKPCETCAKQYKDDCLLEECMEPCNTFAGGDVPYEWRGLGDKPHEVVRC